MLPECNAAAEILRVILAVALPEDRLLLPHASALHAHVVHSSLSLIAVVAVLSMVYILGGGQAKWQVFGFSPILESLVLCWIT